MATTKHNQTNIRPKLKKKLVLVRFEHRTFAVPGIFVSTRLSEQETIQSLNSIWSKEHQESNLFTGKSLVPDCNTLAYRKDNYVCISNVPRLQVTLNKFLHLIQGPLSNFLERVGEFSNKISTFVFFRWALHLKTCIFWHRKLLQKNFSWLAQN